MTKPSRGYPDAIEVVVEIPRGSRNKYEYDEAAGICLDDVQPHRLVEIENFFETYKLLEDKTVVVLGWRDQARAREALGADRAAWDREVATRGASR